jgi:catechol 2,3-dioxygenase-like lactoylglutathione lyase family enzyme
MAGARLRGIAPLVPVRDLAASVAFYRDALGFQVAIDATEHAFVMVARDGARIGLQGGADEDTLAVTRTNIAAYVLVDDVEALWKEIGPRCADLPPQRVLGPFMQDYGVRELHLKDPDGFLMLFGEAVERAA